jgi:hypothetical protein
MATEPYIWGGGDATPDPLTNAKLNQTTTHFTERIDAEAAVSNLFAQDPDTTTGLVFGYKAGRVVNDNVATVVAAGTKALTASTINYIELDLVTPAVHKVTGGFTSGRRPLFQVTTNGGGITSVDDVRTWADAGSGSTVYTAGDGLAESGGEFSIPADAVTDEMLGERTIDDSLVPADDTDELNPLLSGLANRIKAATGETNWYDAPDTTLAAAATHIADASPHSGHFDVDGSKPLTGDMDAGGNQLTNLGTPSASTDAVTKEYADALANGVIIKQSVKVATTGNITLSGEQSIDSVAVVAGDRVLVKNQVTQSANGIYVASAGAWSRATDADADAEMEAGVATFVEFGTTHAGQRWTLITPSVVVGTTAQQWTQDSSLGSGESNTTSNTGTGAQFAKAKSGVDFPFRTLVAGSDAVTVTQGTDEVEIDVDPAELDLSAMGGTLGPTQGGTGQTTTALGDLLYGSGTNTIGKLAGNTTTTKKLLAQTGNGTVSAAPGWVALAGSDVPVFGGSGAGHAAGAVPDPGSVYSPSLILTANGWQFASSVLSTVATGDTVEQWLFI